MGIYRVALVDNFLCRGAETNSKNKERPRGTAWPARVDSIYSIYMYICMYPTPSSRDALEYVSLMYVTWVCDIHIHNVRTTHCLTGTRHTAHGARTTRETVRFTCIRTPTTAGKYCDYIPLTYPPHHYHHHSSGPNPRVVTVGQDEGPRILTRITLVVYTYHK